MGRIKGIVISIFSVGLLAGLLWLGGILSEGVRRGIVLCLTNVIPSLFLFTVLTNWMGSTRILTWLGKGVSVLGQPLMGLDASGCGVLLFSLLGGYPVGAALLAQLVSPRADGPQAGLQNALLLQLEQPRLFDPGRGGTGAGQHHGRYDSLAEPACRGVAAGGAAAGGRGQSRLPFPALSQRRQLFWLPQGEHRDFRGDLRHGDLMQRVVSPAGAAAPALSLGLDGAGNRRGDQRLLLSAGRGVRVWDLLPG